MPKTREWGLPDISVVRAAILTAEVTEESGILLTGEKGCGIHILCWDVKVSAWVMFTGPVILMRSRILKMTFGNFSWVKASCLMMPLTLAPSKILWATV